MIVQRRNSIWVSCIGLLIAAATSTAAEPRLSRDSYRLELVASEPDIVTPIGMAFDHQGRLLVVESHTHQRPKDYPGPDGDRIRMFADTDGDGRLDRWSTFAEGFKNAMNLLVRPDGAVYVASRQDVQLLRDTDGDGKADETQTILKLETADTYPHNGLEGIAIASDGALLASMGENHGMEFRLVGSDEIALTGQGEGGSMFRCSQDGKKLERFAIGFWNPFSFCVMPGGRIFAADNDPDASPPCRLVDVVPGGDYGFRFRYGRSGLHPLQAWNGELPGTLPMVCGVGEAPTAIVLHDGRLWVTSWGDHCVEAYTLVPRGASFSAQREIVVQGDADFRPTGMAAAPDGSLYFGDWIRREYGVHGHGRIWHLILPKEDEARVNHSDGSLKTAPTVVQTADIDAALAAEDPFVRAAGVWAGSKAEYLVSRLLKSSTNAKVRLGYLEALLIKGTADAEKYLAKALTDESADVRLFAVRWIADDRIAALREQVARLLDEPQSDSRYYLAVLAAVDWLSSDRPQTTSGLANALLVRELENDSRSPAARSLMLNLLSPDDKFLTSDRLEQYLRSDYTPLRLEAVRALAQQTKNDRFKLLAKIAQDEQQNKEIRAEAMMGLAAAADQHRELLNRLAADDRDLVLKHTAETVLRLARSEHAADDQKPPADNIAAWMKLLETPGDAAAGRRLFFSSVGARCSVCHQYNGRGGRIGPDLTQVGRTSSRERIVTSILQPSREIAPEFQPYILVTKEGQSRVGLRLPKPGDDGIEDYADAAGQKFSLPSEAIEMRTASPKSIMPDGLEKTISINDLRDLITFLTTPVNPNELKR